MTEACPHTCSVGALPADQHLHRHSKSTKIRLVEVGGDARRADGVRHARITDLAGDPQPLPCGVLDAGYGVIARKPLIRRLVSVREVRRFLEPHGSDAAAHVRRHAALLGQPVAANDAHGVHGDGIGNAEAEDVAVHDDSALAGLLEVLERHVDEEVAEDRLATAAIEHAARLIEDRLEAVAGLEPVDRNHPVAARAEGRRRYRLGGGVSPMLAAAPRVTAARAPRPARRALCRRTRSHRRRPRIFRARGPDTTALRARSPRAPRLQAAWR